MKKYFLILILSLVMFFSKDLVDLDCKQCVDYETKEQLIVNAENLSINNNNLEVRYFKNEEMLNSINDESTVEMDSYENNNNIYYATKLNPDNFTQLYRYTSTIDANLDTLDIDYYYFNLVTDCHVDISILTNDSNYTFDFDFMQ